MTKLFLAVGIIVIAFILWMGIWWCIDNIRFKTSKGETK